MPASKFDYFGTINVHGITQEYTGKSMLDLRKKMGIASQTAQRVMAGNSSRYYSITRVPKANAPGNKSEIFKNALIEVSDSDNFEEALQEYRVVDMVHSEKGSQTQCICTQSILTVCNVAHIRHGFTLTIGKDCIKKFGTSEQKQAMTDLERAYRESLKRACEAPGCNKRFLRDEHGTELCGRCAPVWARCERCPAYHECPESKRKWRKLCPKCYFGS
jgi:hypothetical protein